MLLLPLLCWSLGFTLTSKVQFNYLFLNFLSSSWFVGIFFGNVYMDDHAFLLRLSWLVYVLLFNFRVLIYIKFGKISMTALFGCCIEISKRFMLVRNFCIVDWLALIEIVKVQLRTLLAWNNMLCRATCCLKLSMSCRQFAYVGAYNISSLFMWFFEFSCASIIKFMFYFFSPCT